MTYAKLDDLYDTKRKIKRAWKAEPACVGLHAMAITYTTREKTDGVVDSEWVEEKLPNRLNRERILGLMVDLRLFDPVNPPANSDLSLEYWYVHDYLDFNDSREKREQLSQAGKAGAEARWGESGMRSASQSHSQPDAVSNTDGSTDRNGPPHLHHTTPITTRKHDNNADRLSHLLAELILERAPKANVKVSPRWRNDMRLLIADQDGDVAGVERVLRWSQADPFWQSNILSPAKLRKQFTQLSLKMASSPRLVLAEAKDYSRFNRAAGLESA